jgi:L-threonylcarbamoyladenylate synthase
MKVIKKTDLEKVFIAPTEGLWGLSAPASNQQLVEKIYALKKRNLTKPLIILYTEKTQDVLENWVNWQALSESDREFYFINRFKFITFLLPASLKAPDYLTLDAKISFRYIHSGSIKRIINTLGQAIVSTSANISGQASLNRLKGLKKTFPQLPIMRGRLGGKTGGSAIIDLISKNYLR